MRATGVGGEGWAPPSCRAQGNRSPLHLSCYAPVTEELSKVYYDPQHYLTVEPNLLLTLDLGKSCSLLKCFSNETNE